MSPIPGITPEIADIARDVLALARAAGNQDEQALIALCKPLDLEQTRYRLLSMATLTAALMRELYGDDWEHNMTVFAQNYLT